MNFVVTKKGPVVPPDVNPKFFNSVKIAALGNLKFKTGNVVKFTAGKCRVRNEEETKWNDANSAWVEKDDILAATGPVYAENFDKEQHVAARVFQAKA